MRQLLRNLWDNDQGQDIAEYAMLLTVILLITAASVTAIGSHSDAVFSAVGQKLATT